MSTTNGAHRKRRSIDVAPKTHLIRLTVDAATRERLDELSDRYQVAAGTIARAVDGSWLPLTPYPDQTPSTAPEAASPPCCPAW